MTVGRSVARQVVFAGRSNGAGVRYGQRNTHVHRRFDLGVVQLTTDALSSICQGIAAGSKYMMEGHPRRAGSPDHPVERVPIHSAARRSCKSRAVLGDKGFDRLRWPAADPLDEIVGSREHAIGMVDGDLTQMLDQELAAWPTDDAIGLGIE